MKSAIRISICAFFLGVAIGRPEVGAAQESPEQHLTGGSSQEWVFRRLVVSLGPGDSCTSGETYTFSTDHALVIRKCVNGHLASDRLSWHLGHGDAGDTDLVIDGKGTFILLFRDTPDGQHFMRLRQPGPVPTQPTVDKEFRLSGD